MAHTPLTAAQTDQNSPGDQTLFDLIRLLDVDLTTRVAALEDPATFYFNHFERNHRYTSGIVLSNAGAATLQNYDKDFTLKVDGAEIQEEIAVTADAHWMEFKKTGGGVGRSSMELNRQIYYDNRTKPIIFSCRLRVENNGDTTDMFIGLHDGSIAAVRPTNGIYLEVQTVGSLWRFVSSNAGTNTVGTGFAPPTADTWFDFEINWSVSGASCKINGIEKELLTTNLPTAKAIYSNVCIQTTNTTENAIRVDEYLLSLGGPLADAA